MAHLGNTGSVALPMTAAIGIENGHVQKDDRLGLLGIGSGINVLMLAVDWQRSPARRDSEFPDAREKRLRQPDAV